jgi:hypothetical protein
MLEIVVDTKTVEPMIETKRRVKYNAGFFIIRAFGYWKSKLCQTKN